MSGISLPPSKLIKLAVNTSLVGTNNAIFTMPQGFVAFQFFYNLIGSTPTSVALQSSVNNGTSYVTCTTSGITSAGGTGGAYTSNNVATLGGSTVNSTGFIQMLNYPATGTGGDVCGFGYGNNGFNTNVDSGYILPGDITVSGQFQTNYKFLKPSGVFNAGSSITLYGVKD